MQVIESAEQSQVARHQHTVAEHVARHVADSDQAQFTLLDVAPELAEMPLDELPGAARSDPHCLVIVARRTARRERITKPEPALLRDGVGEVRERRGPLVRCDNEIWVVPVTANDLRRRYDPVPLRGFCDNIVSEV